MVFEYGWNRGIANSGHQLQEALAMHESGWDRDIGPMTLKALAGVQDMAALINGLSRLPPLRRACRSPRKHRYICYPTRKRPLGLMAGRASFLFGTTPMRTFYIGVR